MLLTSRLAARVPKTLIIGGGGQLGPGLARVLRSSYGTENVILSDVRKANNPEAKNGKASTWWPRTLVINYLLIIFIIFILCGVLIQYLRSVWIYRCNWLQKYRTSCRRAERWLGGESQTILSISECFAHRPERNFPKRVHYGLKGISE